MKIAGHAAAQVLRLAHIDDLALGILVQIHAGLGGNGADFLKQIHDGTVNFSRSCYG